jgi:hypothetical protein
MASIPDKFPPGTSFYDCNGIPLTRGPNGGILAWSDNPATGKKAPRMFGLSTWTFESDQISEEDWRERFARSKTSSAASE